MLTLVMLGIISKALLSALSRYAQIISASFLHCVEIKLSKIKISTGLVA
jgi:hypothetical protein